MPKYLAVISGVLFVLSLPSVSVAKPNQMAGIDWATKGYRQAAREANRRPCSGYVAICMRRGNDPSVCQSAGAMCRQTGIFVGPRGGRFLASERR